MSQRDIYQFLEENKNKWYSSQDLADVLRLNPNTIINNLKRMRRYKNIISEYKQEEKPALSYEGKSCNTKNFRYYYMFKEF